MPTRKIKLVHLTDGGIRTVIDDGCNIERAPNIARAQLKNLLAKRMVERDPETNEVVLGKNGRPLLHPVVRLAEPPPRLEYNLANEKERDIAAADRFDDEELSKEGDWLLPTDEWKAASQRFQAARKKHQDTIDVQALAQQQQAVGAGVGQLLDMLRNQAGVTAPKRGGARVAEATAG